MTIVETEPMPTRLNTAAHHHGPGRPCVHLLSPLPETILLNRDAVARLNFQPRIIASDALIAARRGNVLILSFDVIGTVHARHPKRGARDPDPGVHNHFRYVLCPDPDSENLLLAVTEIAA
jgi:hypothetical protein